MQQILQFASEITPWIISFGSLLLTYRAMRSAEEQKKYEIYFDKKSKAYAYFLEQMTFVYLNRNAPVTGLSAAYYQAVVYSNQEACRAMNQIVMALNDNRNIDKIQPDIEFLITTIRSDLDECKTQLSPAKRL